MTMGLLDSAQTLLSGVLSLARTRLELFGTELQEALARLFFSLLCAVGVLLLGALAALFGGAAILLCLGAEYRAAAAGMMALGFVALAAGAGFVLRPLVRTTPRPFDPSHGELERDNAALRP